MDDFEKEPQGCARAFIWNKRHNEAYERANSEAVYAFNTCPACGRKVCNRCFQITANATTDVCLDCAASKARDAPRRRFVGRSQY